MGVGWVTDDYIHNFEFDNGVTWLSSWWVPLTVPFIYFGILRLLRAHVEQRGAPYDLNSVVIVHNAFLSIASAALFIALGSELVRMVNASSLFDVYCDDKIMWSSKGPAVFYYYVNYLFKYFELIDTFLLVLRAKPTPFLHVYHHAATLVLCWSQLRAESCLQWTVIIFNLLVHVIMYLYYSLHACGIDVWWKRYLTVFQIIQFVVAVTSCLGGLIPRALWSLGFTWSPACHGEFLWSFFGVGVLASYLVLFVKLYQESYKEGKARAGKAKAAAAAHRPSAHSHSGANGAVLVQNGVNGVKHD